MECSLARRAQRGKAPSTLRIGALELPTRYVLAPLAGYTNLPFRLALRELGPVGLATTDLVNARALLVRNTRTLELIETCTADRPLAVQIYGADPVEMAAAAQWLGSYGVSAVDVNMGCPVHKVVRGGGGSALMCDTQRTIRLVQSIVEAARIPVTVKMRLGWDDDNWSAPFFAREFEQVGVAAVTIHGRTRQQGFGGVVQLEGIRAVVEAVDRMPVIGNGDVRTIAEAERMLSVTGCHGISIGRGALANPWIFRDLAACETTGRPGPMPGHAQRTDFMERHFQLLLAQRGERFACLTFRKVANWYCKALRPGRDIQQRLVRLGSAAEFSELVNQIRALGEKREWAAAGGHDLAIPVPRGPVERW